MWLVGYSTSPHNGVLLHFLQLVRLVTPVYQSWSSHLCHLVGAGPGGGPVKASTCLPRQHSDIVPLCVTAPCCLLCNSDECQKSSYFCGFTWPVLSHPNIFFLRCPNILTGFMKLRRNVGRVWEWMGWGKGGKEISILIVLCLFL